MKILEIGGGPEPKAHKYWKDAEITTLDADKQYNPDILADAGKLNLPTQYDAIFASHVLEHFFWAGIETVFSNWVKHVKPGGEMYIIVPSLEWVTTTAKLQPFIVQPHLIGGHTTKWDVHKCMFTKPMLESLFEKSGLTIESSCFEKYIFVCIDTLIPADEIHVRGRKII